MGAGCTTGNQANNDAKYDACTDACYENNSLMGVSTHDGPMVKEKRADCLNICVEKYK